MKTTTLFLDVDGPLHPPLAVIIGRDGKVYGDEAFCWLEPLLKVLDEWPALQVVVHSTWRFHWETDAELRARLPAALAERVVCATPREFPGRYESIQAYCEQNKIRRFVIVDDERAAFPLGLPQLIVSGPAGLSDPATLQALRNAVEDVGLCEAGDLSPPNPTTVAAIQDAKACRATPVNLDDL